MTIILRTHGGLGNQLFQILFARLFARAERQPCAEIHDANYRHGFARSAEIAAIGGPASATQRVVSWLRIPKILSRAGIYPTDKVNILGDIYLDGYFQKAEDFLAFPDDMIAFEVSTLRSELQIQPQMVPDDRTLYHIRLGDFFDDREQALGHAIQRVERLQANSAIITNQEDIFADDRMKKHLQARGCRLHITKHYSSEDVIRLMSGYGHIVTNNSTLALWASILGNCQTTFDEPRLAAVHEYLFKAANPASFLHASSPPSNAL